MELSPDADRQEELRQARIFSALRTIAGPDGVIAGTTQQIVERLKNVTAIDVPDLHDVLAQWRFSEKSTRLAGFDTPRKAWELAEAELGKVEATLRDDGIPS